MKISHSDASCFYLLLTHILRIFFGRITTGASDDLSKVTKIASELCGVYGMSPAIGPISYGRQEQDQLQKPFSEKTAELLDSEVRKLIMQAHERTTKLLQDKKSQVEKVAKLLLEKEMMCVPP